MDADDGRRERDFGRSSAKKVNLTKFAHLFFSAFLAEALTATGAALICVAEMTNIILLSCSSMTSDRADGRSSLPWAFRFVCDDDS